MSQPKRGDVVLLSLGAKTYNAIVLLAHATLESHLGEQGEPQLHLAYLPDELLVNGKPKVQQPGYIPQVAYIFDVVHASHEFDTAYLQSHGLRKVIEGDPNRASAEAEIRNRRGAGEWSEVPAIFVSPEHAARIGLVTREPLVAIPARADSAASSANSAIAANETANETANDSPIE